MNTVFLKTTMSHVRMSPKPVSGMWLVRIESRVGGRLVS